MEDKPLILITGASKGIGEKIATLFAEDNYIVVAISRNIKSSSFYNFYAKHKENLICYEADISKEKDIKSIMNNIAKINESIDILVNNAGICIVKPFYMITGKEWNEIIKTNLTSLFLFTKYALPLMQKRENIKKHIFNILSIASERAFRNWSAYCASKFGALGFSECIRQELTDFNIKITSILPGATDTELWNKVPGNWDRKKMLNPNIIAQVIKETYEKPKEASIEKIIILPEAGEL